MTAPSSYKWRRFQVKILLLCIRWSWRYALGSRNLKECMRERGRDVDQTVISRLVQ